MHARTEVPVAAVEPDLPLRCEARGRARIGSGEPFRVRVAQFLVNAVATEGQLHTRSTHLRRDSARTSPRQAARGRRSMTFRLRLTMCVATAHLVAGGPTISAVTLEPRTVAAFDRYVAETERESARSLGDEAGFLWVDAPGRERDRAALRAGQLVLSRLETKSAGRKIDVPDGLIHHWLGLVFVPGATVDRAVALLQDYDRHAAVYTPNVARSRLIAGDGDTFKVYLRFYTKKVL